MVVPFPIACGACGACARELYSACENSNPNAVDRREDVRPPAAGIFGYSHLTGGYAGGQAQYARVPFADVGPLKIEADLTDEQVLFLSDILPTGYMGAEMCDIQPGDVVAVWGAARSASSPWTARRLLGAAKVIAIDKEPYRRRWPNEARPTTPVNFEEADGADALAGPDRWAGTGQVHRRGRHGSHHDGAHIDAYDRVKQAVRSETDRPHALRQAIVVVPQRRRGLGDRRLRRPCMDKFPAGAG